VNALRIFANGLVPDPRGDEPDARQVELCRTWLKMHATKRKTFNLRAGSYGLKHVVEDWTSGLGVVWLQRDPWGRRFVSSRRYVSNGAFIAAAIAEGYRVQQIGNGPNAIFDMSFRKAGVTR
jgi:hypothetical protein